MITKLERTRVQHKTPAINESNSSSPQCYSVLSDILVKNELCIPLVKGSNVLSTGKDFICLFPPSKLKFAVLFCSFYKKTISFSAIAGWVVTWFLLGYTVRIFEYTVRTF